MKRIAEARCRSPHWLILETIQQYSEEKREDFRQGGIKAWEEYQTSGLHVTHEESDGWLGRGRRGR